MNYNKLSKETIGHLYKSYQSLKTSSLDATIRVLIEVYVSQLNGCDFCLRIHSAEATNVGISQEKLDSLAEWQHSNLFSDKEKTVLSWCNIVTKVNNAAKSERQQLTNHFSDKEIVDITACIAIMNALNRVAIFLRDE